MVKKYSNIELKDLPFRNSKLDIDKRVDDLLNRLTLDEKLKLLAGYRIFNTQPIKRLAIPSLKMTDGPFGVAMHSSFFRKNTRFPGGIALAASWNRQLAHQFGVAVAEEVRAVGRHVLLAPGINLHRTPLNGRTFEYFSEDPFLTSEIAILFIKGLQSQRIAACVKHYAANNQEFERKRISAEIDERALHEIYLRAFRSVVKKADPWSIMTSYNKINGIYGSEHEYLLKEILVEKWGFNGFIVSDWNATELLNGDHPNRCIKAGLSLEMPKADKYRINNLKEDISKNIINETLIDLIVRRLIRVFFQVGLFEEQHTLPQGIRNNTEHQILARQMAEESIVLLKNNGLLPLDKSKIKTIAVLGPNKNKKFGKLLYGGSSAVKPPYEITSLKGLKKKCGESIQLISDAKEADVAILFVGLNHDKEKGRKSFIFGGSHRSSGNDTEGADRIQLELPREQVDLILQTSDNNPRTIVILINGSPIAMDPWINNIPAVLEAWYPGMEGGYAIANILFGDVNPSGKLPITFPKKLSDSPAHASNRTYPGDLEKLKVYYEEGIFVGYRHFDKNDIEPLFPFGFGLSYSTFEYKDLQLDTKCLVGNQDSFIARVSIRNTGSYVGSEIVQVYTSDLESSVQRPVKELIGFTKVRLNPLEDKIIELPLKTQDMAFYNTDSSSWVVEPGSFKILVGSSSRTIHLEEVIEFEN